MVNGELNFRADPGDLALQQHDARLQLADRQRVEILLHDRSQGIVEACARFVTIHIAQR